MVNIPVPRCLLKLRKKDETGANSKRDMAATCDANRIRSSSVDLTSGRYIFTIFGTGGAEVFLLFQSKQV